MIKRIIRIDLKKIEIATNGGAAILHYEVVVPIDFGKLSEIYKRARESLLKKVMREIK